MTHAELLVVLATKTGMTQADWDRFLRCTLPQQQAIAQMYKDASWAQDADVFGEVIAALTVAATIAGAVAGIGTAIQVLRAL